MKETFAAMAAAADTCPSLFLGLPMPSEQQLLAELTALRSEVAGLRATVDTLEKENTTLSDNVLIQLQLIKQLQEAARREPGKTEISRAEKIEKYLAARPDHKATFETLKGHLRIDNVLLNQAIKTLMDRAPGRYGITRAPGDKRKRTLVMLPK